METANKNDWMVNQSFERSLEVISAINRVSIDAKLRLAGVSQGSQDSEVTAARSFLQGFVSTLSGLAIRAQESEDRIAFGADPRMSSLARQFLGGRQQSADVVAYDLSELQDLETLLKGESNVDYSQLVERLAHLRSALEQHGQTDAAIIFNEV